MNLFQQPLSIVAQSVEFQELDWPELNYRGLTVYLRRDDQLSTTYSGNKFYKLYYNIRNAKQQGHTSIVSFGGYYSNHLHALAAAGKELNLPTVGIIRGHKPKVLSPTLIDAKEWGMALHFISRKEYSDKELSSILPILKAEAGNYLLVPEGGENLAGVRGTMAIAQAVADFVPDRHCYLCAASGTGATLAGMAAGSPDNIHCLGFSVLKGKDNLSPKVARWLSILGKEQAQWKLIDGYHHGGYAKVSEPLLDFMKKFEQRNQLLLDPVYTGKLLWAIEDLAKQDYWPRGSTIVAVHSGGLQGRRGFAL